ncbi:hydrolase, TatD family [Desulfotomaculum nigrificans CO-1-SRB]|uniref:Hydrolase, TatD family n=1 Tax=Desulfotomaculum nigrificans (strain DSM 14880 / VKM B-2319 / CO-1-SRB) TaxID=868595 RepID=F6B3Y7_DESCC|nr:TatD family hydrolase [Desulfotomaculum nigrificans]AEF92952.1 hydrolase, TatD family [Desulfotomaculum nigrificans CO-1-SRB]
MLIDSHAHLDNERFDDDRAAVIGRCREELNAVINVGYDMESSRRSIALAEEFPFIYAAVGVHPHDAKEAPGDYLDQLKQMAAHPKVVAIGEIGLDYYYDLSPRDVQQRSFQEQLLLAKELDLPFIIHDRDAHGDIMQILRQAGPYPAGGVMHCFSASWEIAQECMKLGLYISLAGPVTFNNAGKLKDIAVKVPLERLLVETDCPYLTPVPYRGKRNEPAYVRHVVNHIAQLRGMNPEELANITAANTISLFKLELTEETDDE